MLGIIIFILSQSSSVIPSIIFFHFVIFHPIHSKSHKMIHAATNPIYVFNAYILFSGLYNKSACLQVSTRGQGQRSININVFTVILTTRFSNTRFADDHFGLCPFFFFFFFGGGTQIFARILYPCPKSEICLGNAFFAHAMGGGGGGCLEEENTILFLSDCV